MRFASVIAALTRAIQPNTDFHKHGDTSIVFAARDLPVHPLLPRAPNYLPMGAHLLPRPIPSIRIPLICRSSAPTPAPTMPRIDRGTLVRRIILSNPNLRSAEAYIYFLHRVATYGTRILYNFPRISIPWIRIYIYIYTHTC